MFDQIFASYLQETNKLTKDDLTQIFATQESKRVRLGVIAIAEKLMTTEQVEEVNQLQAIYDKRFGDIAIDKGYLNEEQVSRLLSLQGNSFLTMLQAMIDGGYLTMEEINSMLDVYQHEQSLTLMNLEDLKSCDVDKILPMYFYDCPTLLTRLAGVMVRTVLRLIDYHAYIQKPHFVSSYSYQALSHQELFGQHHILTALSGSNKAMLYAAKQFAGSEFVETKEDALDGLCELINNVNGLLASECSRENLELDMKAPLYCEIPGVLSANSILCLPIIIDNCRLDLLMVLDNEYQLIEGEE